MKKKNGKGRQKQGWNTSSGLIYNSASNHDFLHLNHSPNTFSTTGNAGYSKISVILAMGLFTTNKQ